MEEKQADGVGGNIPVSRCLLLIDIHISQLRMEVRRELVADAGEEAVLVKRIVNNLSAEVDEHFVHDGDKRCFGRQLFAGERDEKG